MSTFLAIVGLIALCGMLICVLCEDEVKACFDRDPAARNLVEVLLTYSGLHVVVAHRIAHPLEKLGIPLLPRLIMTVARAITGVEIHPAAVIGRGLFIDHGMGVVIGETAVIGKNVTLFQGVTLGGTGKQKGKRHPNIGDNVVIGTGAKVLGSITIGAHSIIGANAVVIRDVPPHSTVVGVPGRVAKVNDKSTDDLSGNLDHRHLPDPLMEHLAHLQRRVKQEIHAMEEDLHALERKIKDRDQPPSDPAKPS